ncbi:DUF6779 domain-containing protein [Geodermatophilus sp. SYSU D01045]
MRTGGGLRVAGQVLGCVLATAATAVVFLSDDPQVLRVAVVAVAWACLGAAFAAGRRPEPAAGGADVAALEAQLRRAHEAERERDAAAHRQSELQLEARVRGEAEASMRRELDGLRAELTGLRGDLAGLGALHAEVAAIGALRGDLAELAGLRADVGRLRAELTERSAGELHPPGELHHSGEMHIERVVMRTQSVRTGRDPLEPATAAWHAAVPRELGGWAAPSDGAGTAVPATVAVPLPAPEPLPELLPEPEPVARVVAPPPVPRRRRTDLPADLLPPAPQEQLTLERPSVHAAAAGHGRYGAPADDEAGAARLAQILAESGVTPGGRRRRYRDA